ncbi:hypothetical protein PIB30_099239, partial [Stylosanthes scabra]|nr:hypothetical protein [Stylosanthes scabra]
AYKILNNMSTRVRGRDNLTLSIGHDVLEVGMLQKGKCNLAEVLDESPVKSYMTKKRTNLPHYGGVRQTLNYINLSWVNSNTFLRDNVS